MTKEQEIKDPDSCLNRARPGEMVFVLRAHDPCAAQLVRIWTDLRIFRGKNKPEDKQIMDALACADMMDEQRLAEKSAEFVSAVKGE